MSDGEAPAPAAPAEAPSEGAAPVEGQDPAAPKPPPKARTIDDDLEDVFKKHQTGAPYKAGGKEKQAKSWAEAKRLLSKVDGTESAAAQAAKDRQQADAMKAQVSALAKMKPAERLQALGNMGIDRQALREAYEAEILEEDEKSKAQAHLSPREREYAAQIQERDAELAQYREQQQAAKAEQEQQAYVQRVTQTGQRLEHTAVAALQKANIPKEHATKFLNVIAERLDRNERLGLELDEGELADMVVEEHGQLADQYYGSLDISAMADRFEAMQVDDPDKPGSKTSRANLLKREWRRRIEARQNGGTPQPTRGASNGTAQPAGETIGDKLSFWRR